MIYWDHGAAAFDPIFDGLRTAILDDRAHGWCVVPKQGTPTDNVRLIWGRRRVDGREGMPVMMSVFGVELCTDALRRDLSKEQLSPPGDFNPWEF